MNNTSLADSYLKLSGLDSALSKLVSEFAATQLQSLVANSLKNSLDIFQSSLSSISQLASDITFTPELQKALDSLISSIGSTSSQSLASVISSALLDFAKSSDACFSASEDFVTLNKPEIKELTVPETIAVPIGNKRIRMSTNMLIAIIGSILLPLFFHLTDTIISLHQSAAESLSVITHNRTILSCLCNREKNHVNQRHRYKKLQIESLFLKAFYFFFHLFHLITSFRISWTKYNWIQL